VSGLFIDIMLDEDVNVLVAEIVRSRGFNVITTSEIGRNGKSDEEQLEFSSQNQYAILTHNRIDFENLAKEYFVEGKTHCGVIIAVRRAPQEIARRLFVILNSIPADEMVNQTVYI
jgi:predicted nuclease of predicted toxin-antitoxin system